MGKDVIKRLRLQRFKQFANQTIDLRPEGVTLIAGGNNAGKSSMLHSLAVWEFCRTAIEMERGQDAFVQGSNVQGLGLGDDEFSPVSLPSLKHLWTNLKTQKREGDPDGFTLRIGCEWEEDSSRKELEFGLSLANDRLFAKATSSNLMTVGSLPVMAYLPPFAGITDREMKVSPAIRRRRTGEGLAGAVLRNLLLEMYEANVSTRTRLRGSSTKIKDSDLKRLRANDPWELLQQTMREQFNAELIVEPFRDEYHSYIRVEIDKGVVNGYKLKRHHGYNTRDLMVEGSGFLQWLSVYALATSPQVDVLLLDEPDAHLHPTLQTQLVESLADLASRGDKPKQVLIATHSAELLRQWPSSQILEVRSSSPRARYLSEDHQKVGLLAGIGSDYAPRIDPIRKAHRVLFLEGTSDQTVLKQVATVLGYNGLDSWPVWITSDHHKERKQLVKALGEDIPGLIAVSLRDLDDEALNSVTIDLDDKSHNQSDSFIPLKWQRRHIESYLLHPAAVARATGKSELEIISTLADRHAIAIPDTYCLADCPDTLRHANGKEILIGSSDGLLVGTNVRTWEIAAELTASEVCEDFRTFFRRLDEALAQQVARAGAGA
ncbi:MAG: AAA family ATPase [Acidimicrobiales bacterium]